MTHPFSIRVGAEADLAGCVLLARRAEPGHGSDAWSESFRGDLEDPGRLLVVADDAGPIVGYGRARRFEPAPDAPADSVPAGYYLSGVFVLPEQRGRGLATSLTRARLDWIGERAAEAWYFANARNTVSIELHRKLGFEEVSRRFSFPGLTFDGGEGILFRRSF